jgi:UDP-N-acetyl-D-mannosaminuronate dehydrogenase
MIDIGIIGYGEIGQALEKCYLNNSQYKVYILDTYKNIHQLKPGVEVLNICIPFKTQEDFINDVSSYIIEYKPKYTIIHSTVTPGTTKKLIELTNHNIVHSPIRGVHPNLYEGLKTFIKYIGGEDEYTVEQIESHYKSLGIKYETFSDSTTTELAKILSTTYYGMCIAFHHDINTLCNKFGVKFEEVATKWNDTYNKGYQEQDMDHFTRPVLYPPKNGEIGGHCIISNAKLSKEFSDSIIFQYILDREKK